MKPQISLGKFVMIVFGGYFAFQILRAFSKLQSDQIGTIFRRVKEKTLQGNQCCYTNDILEWATICRNQCSVLFLKLVIQVSRVTVKVVM